MATSGHSQVIAKHKWKDRLVLILSTDENTLITYKQLKELKSDPGGVKDRNLVVYQVYPTVYKIGLQNQRTISASTVYSQFKKMDSQFEIVLIGLDGSVKLRETSPVSLKRLFRLIDSMPMRKNEIRKKNRK